MSKKSVGATLVTKVTPFTVRVISINLSAAPTVFVSARCGSCTASTTVVVATDRLPFRCGKLGFFAGANKTRRRSVRTVLRCTCRVPRTFTRRRRATIIARVSLLSACTTSLRRGVHGNVTSTRGPRGPLAKHRVVISTNGKTNKFFIRQILRPLKTGASNDRFLSPSNAFPGRIPGPSGGTTVGDVRSTIVTGGTSLKVVFSASISHSTVISDSKGTFGHGGLVTLVSRILLGTRPNTAVIAGSTASTRLRAFVANLNKIRSHCLANCQGIVGHNVRLGRTNAGTILTVRADKRTTLGRGCFLSSNTCLVTGLLVTSTRLSARKGHLNSLVTALNRPTRAVRCHFAVVRRPVFRINGTVVGSFTTFVTTARSVTLVTGRLRNIHIGLDNRCKRN